MKRGSLSFSDVRRLRQGPAFVFLVAVLLCGVLAGLLTGMHIPRSEGGRAGELAALVARNAAGQMPALRTVLVCAAGTFGWAAAAVVLGGLPGRMLWVGLLTALRGFLLAFAAAAALAQSGWSGIYISAVSIGVPAVLWLPALLLVCAAVLDAAGGAGRRGYLAALLRRYPRVLLLCTAMLLASLLWRLLAVPPLLGLAGL